VKILLFSVAKYLTFQELKLPDLEKLGSFLAFCGVNRYNNFRWSGTIGQQKEEEL